MKDQGDIQLKNSIHRFAEENEGSTSVETVGMIAAVIVLGLAATAIIKGGLEDSSTDISDQMSGLTISTSFSGSSEDSSAEDGGSSSSENEEGDDSESDSASGDDSGSNAGETSGKSKKKKSKKKKDKKEKKKKSKKKKKKKNKKNKKKK